MKGQLEAMTELTLLKEGTVKSGKNKGRPWKLYGTTLTVNGADYGLTGFSSKELEEKLSVLEINDEIQFETEERDGYVNIKQDTEIQVLGRPVPGEAAPAKEAPKKPALKKPTIPFMKDEEVFALMDKCIDHIHEKLAKGKIAVQSLDETTTMINSLFIACREERKGERRWE